jgi:hypothetical protein
MKVLLSFIVVLFFVGCLESEQTKKPLIGDFIKSEMERLQKAKPQVTKIALLNGKTDTVFTDSLDWKKELNIFLMNDLDSSQLVNYNVSNILIIPDSVQYKKTVYQSINAEEKIKSLSIAKAVDSTHTESVEILIQKKHELFSYYKKLIYNAKTGYEISGSQDIKFIDGIDYKVMVNFK